MSNQQPSTSSPNDRLQQIVNHFDSRNSSKKLSGKVCILTGIGHELGIGWATAVLFAKEDAKHLYLLDLKGDKFPALVKHLKELNPKIGLSTISGDAAEESVVRSVCQKAMDEQGRLDVFFANAGVVGAAHIGKTSYETSERVIRINTMSCWLALKYASDAMLKAGKGGSIIFTSSAAGLRSGAGSTEYSASKAAVISLAATGANAYPGAAIRVNAVCPGMIQTQMTGPVFQMAKDKSKIGQLCPLRRYAVPDEVASVVLFLASDDSSCELKLGLYIVSKVELVRILIWISLSIDVTGTAIPVDGGLASSLPVIPGRQY
ncbi:hypothetical protein PGT21_013276 [Puccinia graminis f. sp. tritici]|uniref:Uncharacterized protein n=1 Tax=Puccinia graminis f. sp. tritici TaxID=56615 RepID=A0A5B0PXH8_PUCGR|nr:hypothetical protein PGT21_013276 [Puccinia graminis f. sp. tritici]